MRKLIGVASVLAMVLAGAVASVGPAAAAQRAGALRICVVRHDGGQPQVRCFWVQVQDGGRRGPVYISL